MIQVIKKGRKFQIGFYSLPIRSILKEICVQYETNPIISLVPLLLKIQSEQIRNQS